jgi:hypothetical protein
MRGTELFTALARGSSITITDAGRIPGEAEKQGSGGIR